LHPDKRDFGMDQLERMLHDRQQILKILHPLLIEEDPTVPLPTSSTPAPPPENPELNQTILDVLLPADPIYTVRLLPTTPRPRKHRCPQFCDRLTVLFCLRLHARVFPCGDLIPIRRSTPHPPTMPHVQSRGSPASLPRLSPASFPRRPALAISRPADAV